MLGINQENVFALKNPNAGNRGVYNTNRNQVNLKNKKFTKAHQQQASLSNPASRSQSVQQRTNEEPTGADFEISGFSVMKAPAPQPLRPAALE